MSGYSIDGFQKQYGSMTLKMFNENNQEYKDMLGLAEIAEFNRGFKLTKVGKPTKKGTKLTYKAFSTEHEYNEAYEEIKERLKYLLK